MAEGGNAGDVECNCSSGNGKWGNEGGDIITNQENNNNDILERKRR